MTRWLFLLLLLAASVAHARRPPDAALLPTVSVLTFSPGEIYWQRFGHNALLVREPGGEARVYNYGIFDFQQKNFFLNFARGAMLYRLDRDTLDRTLAQYRYENRGVIEQRLNLRPSQARALADFLEWNARPENANYRYDYFRDNCSTRVRDAVDRALDGALRPLLEARRTAVNYRHESVRMMSPLWPLALGIDLLDGPATEPALDLWQQSFLPEIFMQALRGAQLTTPDGIHLPLVAAEETLLTGRGPQAPAQPLTFFSAFMLAGAWLAVLLLALAWRRDRRAARIGFAVLASSLTLIGGVAGLILLAIWTLTDHWAWHANQNLLLLNPLSLLLLPTWIRSARPGWAVAPWARGVALGLAGLALLSLAIKALPLAVQDNGAWIALWLPLHLALVWGLWRGTRPGSVEAPKTPMHRNQ